MYTVRAFGHPEIILRANNTIQQTTSPVYIEMQHYTQKRFIDTPMIETVSSPPLILKRFYCKVYTYTLYIVHCTVENKIMTLMDN